MKNVRRRDIDDFSDYSVTEDGLVINNNSGRILRPSPDRCGYMTVHLNKNGRGYPKRVHRLVAEAFLNPPNDKAVQVNHKNGNKADNRLCNLEFVTPSENMYHSYANGLNHWEGYNERPVRIAETGEVFKSQAECARAIGGSQPNINACLAGRRCTHLGYHFEYAD